MPTGSWSIRIRRSGSSGCSTWWRRSASRTSDCCSPEFNPLHHLTLPANVKHCFHAMSLDERRVNFENTRVDGAYEVWFRGVHSDIGGGNDNPHLDYVALRWMYRKAILCGLPVTEANITDSAVHPEAAIKPNPLSKVSPFWRTVKPSNRHYTVAEHTRLAGEELNPCPAGCLIETVQDEKSRIEKPSVGYDLIT